MTGGREGTLGWRAGGGGVGDWGGGCLGGQGLCGRVGGGAVQAVRVFGMHLGLGVLDVLEASGCATAVARA